MSNITIAFGFAIFVTVGSIIAIPLVLYRNGMTRHGIGLVALLVFWLCYGLRTFDTAGIITYPEPIPLALTVVGVIALLVGVGILAPRIIARYTGV